MQDGIRALIVDDGDINLMVAREILKTLSVTCDLAMSGEEAIGLCRENRYDVVFLDHLMPDMDGIETARRLRELSDTPLVALTANDDPGAKNLFLGHGFSAHITKPLEPDRVSELLIWLLPGKKFLFRRPLPAPPEKDLMDGAPGLDAAKATRKMGGSEEAYYRVLRTFLLSGPGKLKQMDDFVQNRQYDDFRITVHGQKGALANIGADTLSDEARELETSVKNGVPDGFEAKYRAFRDRFSGLLRTIKERLPASDDADASQYTGEEPLSERLQSVLESIRALDYESALTVLRPLAASGIPEAAALAAAKDAVEMFDYDGAEIRLKQLIG